MKSYTEKEVKEIFKEQGYKFASLRDSNNKVVVPYNTAKGKETASDKLNEAFKRLKNLPDGFYTFCFLNNQGRNVKADECGFVKGNLTEDTDLNRGTNVHIIQPNVIKDIDKVLSYSEVLQLKTDMVRLESQCEQYKAHIEQYKKEIADLENELTETQSSQDGLNESSSTGKWVESVTSTLLPIADRWLSILEKKAEQPKQQQRKVVRNPQKIVLPEIGSVSWDAWLTQLEGYTDEQFNNVVNWLQKTSKMHYDAVIEEFNEQESEEVTND